MNRLGIESLNAGAPDIKYTGTEGPQDPRMASATNPEAELHQIYQNALQSGQIPKGTTFEMFKELLQESRAPQQDSGTMAAGTYTQRRRNQMAGGGIMGSNAGSMLVAPTADGSRPGYFGLSDAWDFVTETAVPFVKKYAPPIVDVGRTLMDVFKGGDKPMPQGSPGQINPYTPPYVPEPIRMPQGSPGQMNPYELAKKVLTPNIPSDLLGGDILGEGMPPVTRMPQGSPGQINPYTPPYFPGEAQAGETTGITQNLPQGPWGMGPMNPQKTTQQILSDEIDQMRREEQGDTTTTERKETVKKNIEDKKTKPKDPWYVTLGKTLWPGGDPGYIDLYGGKPGDPGIARQIANIGIPLGVGKWAHDYQKDYLAKQPPFPMDETGIRFQTAQEAMADPKLRFKPEAQYANVAEGGRIGYDEGTLVASAPSLEDSRNEMSLMLFGKPIHELNEQELDILNEHQTSKKKSRTRAQEGGLMNLGGMEKDYRQEGGFVPLGGEEKADDVPARLSKNEFVFTADAVRAAGGGDIDAGAEVMENLMENLEAGGICVC